MERHGGYGMVECYIHFQSTKKPQQLQQQWQQPQPPPQRRQQLLLLLLLRLLFFRDWKCVTMVWHLWRRRDARRLYARVG